MTQPGNHEFDVLDVEVSSLRIRVAIIQIEGPDAALDGPAPALITAAGETRDCYQWRSVREIDARLEKARAILEFIGGQPSDTTTLVVFPEYSLPLSAPSKLQFLQDAANQFNQVIVAGGDSIRQSDTSVIYTQCAIAIPHRTDLVWITKRYPSKWEAQFVDSPPSILRNPIVRFTTGEHSCSVPVVLCSDFLRWVTLPLPNPEHPALYVVPMSSPDMATFRSFADQALGEGVGRAVVLANSIDVNHCGESALYCVTPIGRSHTPALALWEKKESIALFQLDCTRLAPPRRAGVKQTGCLSLIRRFDIGRNLHGKFIIAPQDPGIRQAGEERAVINPSLLEARGKRLRVTFLRVSRFGELNRAALRGSRFDIYETLGQHDLSLTHIGPSEYGFKSDLEQLFASGNTGRAAVVVPEGPDLPYMEVVRFHKVLGHVVSDETADHEPISDEEIQRVSILTTSWQENDLTDDDRTRLQDRKLILGTVTEPDKLGVSATITIYLTAPEDELIAHRQFQIGLLPDILNHDSILTVYKVVSHQIRAHYLLRTRTETTSALFELIEKIHALAGRNELVLLTDTYITGPHLSTIDMETSLREPNIPLNEERFRAEHVFVQLTQEEQVDYSGLAGEEQIARNAAIREMRDNAKTVVTNPEEIERAIVRGVAVSDIELLRDVHERFRSRAEICLRNRVELDIHTTLFESIQREKNRYNGKTLQQLTFGEVCDVVQIAASMKALDETFAAACTRLKTAIPVRNAFAHSRHEEIKLPDVVAACQIYTEFITDWIA